MPGLIGKSPGQLAAEHKRLAAAEKRRAAKAARLKARASQMGPPAPKSKGGFQHVAPEPTVVVNPKTNQRVPRSRLPVASGFQHAAPVRKPPTITRPGLAIAKPSFDTAVRAKKGDKAAQREIALWIKSQKARQASEKSVEEMTDIQLFGQAGPQIKGAAKTANPLVMGIVEELSPSTQIKHLYEAALEHDPGMVAFSAIGLLPAGRVGTMAARVGRVAYAEARAAGATAKAARAAGREASAAFKAEVKAAKASKTTKAAEMEAPPPEPRAQAGFQHGTRTLRAGEQVEQIPQAKSRITRTLIEKPADVASQAMMGEGRIARTARVLMPTASAGQRVLKAGGRRVKEDLEEAVAEAHLHVKELPEEGTDEDIAHFWWAQLPAKHRNAEGLKAVQDFQAAALARVPETLADLKAQRAALPPAHTKVAADIEMRIKDLELMIGDLETSIARLDGLVKKPPRLNPKILNAIHYLSGERRAIFEDLDALAPDVATARQRGVAEALGLESTGEALTSDIASQGGWELVATSRSPTVRGQ